MAIVDGFKGIVIIDPDEETLREYEKKQQDEKNRQELLQQLKGKPTVTKEGKEIKLYANIGEVKDLGAVLQNDAAGIGLFRSEFLYLQSDHFPTEDEQFQSYKTVAEVMAGKKSLSVLWILEQTSRSITLDSNTRTIRRLVTVP